MSDLAQAFQSAGPTGFATIILAFVALGLLSSLVALVKWVLSNTVPLDVHEALRDGLCDDMADVKRDAALLLDRGAR